MCGAPVIVFTFYRANAKLTLEDFLFSPFGGASHLPSRDLPLLAEEEKTWMSGIFKMVSKQLVQAKNFDLI